MPGRKMGDPETLYDEDDVNEKEVDEEEEEVEYSEGGGVKILMKESSEMLCIYNFSK